MKETIRTDVNACFIQTKLSKRVQMSCLDNSTGKHHFNNIVSTNSAFH